MAIHKIGLLIGSGGTTSLTLLASDPAGRADCLALYQMIAAEVAAFEIAIRARLASPAPADLPRTRPIRVPRVPGSPRKTTGRTAFIPARPVTHSTPSSLPEEDAGDVSADSSKSTTTEATPSR